MSLHALRSASLRVTLFACALALAGCASMPARTADGILTNASGMTLYTFDKDTPGSGKSVCNGPCAANWPAFTASAPTSAPAEWTIVTRDDGVKQWAFKGKPLYTFAKDTKPGDKLGDGFLQGAWHVVRP